MRDREQKKQARKVSVSETAKLFHYCQALKPNWLETGLSSCRVRGGKRDRPRQCSQLITVNIPCRSHRPDFT
ncbi:hypothetical protein J6590_010374 [Homalodisca vitripennis]|nr:hypothetical protein J6590_010374 [Homalodisca vitripennis]